MKYPKKPAGFLSLQSNFYVFIVVTGFFLISATSCRQPSADDTLRQGCIEYEIIYLQNTLKTIPTELLPKKMFFRFRDENSIQKIDGFLGFFSIFHMVNQKKSINTTYLKIRNHKYSYPGKKGEIAVGFDTMDGMKIEYLQETKEIAGYTAKSALISFPDTDRNSFIIYYTDEIPLKNPNASNPFHEISGVMLEFQLKFHNLEMLLSAKKLEFKPLSKKEFSPPDDFKPIPRHEMERIIGLLLE